MAWCYEIRGPQDRLVEICSGFETEQEARAAGQRTKRMIDCICFPNPEKLTVLTKQWPDTQRTATRNPAPKYPWQQLVLDAFMEAHSENLLGKINVAERAISTRLVDFGQCKLDEQIALREALMALRRLLREQQEHKEKSNGKEEIA